MRIRITKVLQGSIDGIQLSRLVQGQVYDVNTSLACYLLSEQMAEPAHGESRATLAAEKKTVAPVVPRSVNEILTDCPTISGSPPVVPDAR